MGTPYLGVGMKKADFHGNAQVCGQVAGSGIIAKKKIRLFLQGLLQGQRSTGGDRLRIGFGCKPAFAPFRQDSRIGFAERENDPSVRAFLDPIRGSLEKIVEGRVLG